MTEDVYYDVLWEEIQNIGAGKTIHRIIWSEFSVCKCIFIILIRRIVKESWGLFTFYQEGVISMLLL